MDSAISKRLLSLDVFRGITMAAMVMVNNPGSWEHIYSPLEHSEWNGCTLADVIFPFFLFIVGVSIVYAMQTKKANPASHGTLILIAFKRAAILILISLITQLIFHPGLATLRLPGVLQRIALVFFICTILYLKTSQKSRDYILAFCLVSYYILMCFLPVPGYGPANLEPETNLGAWLDRTVFTPNHLWVYSHTWDPEGLLGALPAIGTGLMGIRVGSWLKRPDRSDSVKTSRMVIFGILAVAAGLLWGLFFPINKALWTSSFVLYTGGLAIIVLAICYWLIDVRGYKRAAAFFVPYGANAITAYVLSMYIPHYVNKLTFGGKTLYDTLFSPYLSPINASLAMAVFWLLVIWVIMWLLYRRKIIIKV